MRCMRCATEITFGWMKLVLSHENPRTGEVTNRLLCEPCADAVEAAESQSAEESAAAADALAHIVTVDGLLGSADGQKEPAE